MYYMFLVIIQPTSLGAEYSAEKLGVRIPVLPQEYSPDKKTGNRKES